MGMGEPRTLARFGRLGESGKCRAVDVAVAGVLLDGRVVAAVEGVGVHLVSTDQERVEVLDGVPRVRVSARVVPAVGVCAARVRRVFAVVGKAGREAKEGRTVGVWAWPVESPSTSTSKPDYSQLQFDARVVRIHAELSDWVLVVCGTPQVSLVSLVPLRVVKSTTLSGEVLESWVVSGNSWVDTTRTGTGMVVLLVRDGETVRLDAVSVAAEELRSVGSVELAGIDASRIVGASCSQTGFLCVLESTGLCTPFEVSVTRSSSSLAATPLPALQFQGLATSPSIGIHALKDSTIAIAGTTVSSPPQLALLVWDVRYSALLAQRTVALPSPLDPLFDVSVSGSSETYVVVTVGPYVLGASLSLPHTSISTMLGASRTNWLVSPDLVQDKDRSALVERVRHEVRAGRPAQADAAFFRWVEDQAGLREGAGTGTLDSALKIPFPSAFAAALVDAAFFDDGEEEDPTVASGIVSALMWRGAARQGMLPGPGGLYAALRRKRDWPIIQSALQHVPDIPEDEIIATIRDLVHPSAPLSNAPRLQNALAHVLAYPTSPAPLRLALRMHLCDAEDLVHVLQVLDGWLKRGLQFDVWELDGLQADGWAGSKTGKTAGVSASTGKKKVKGAGTIPALEHIINFVQAVLDTHLLMLLQYRPAHPLVRSISASLAPLLSYNDALQTLSAPLAPFAAEDALERKSGSAATNPHTWQAKEEWRKRRRAQLAAEAVAIGDYRFEELVL